MDDGQTRGGEEEEGCEQLGGELASEGEGDAVELGVLQ